MSDKVKSITKGKFNRICEEHLAEKCEEFGIVLSGDFIYERRKPSNQYLRYSPIIFYKTNRTTLWQDLSWEFRYKALMVIMRKLDKMSPREMDLIG